MSAAFRPRTPDSPSSLRKATTAIDDLTAALSNFNRVPSPEPPNATVCCCGREDCESSKAWWALKNKLENRLILSAEIGQALLERHEAFVRRHESGQSVDASISNMQDLMEDPSTSKRTQEEVDARVAELVRENAVLEKRLSQALVNNEVVDLTHHTTLEELKRAKEKIAQMSAQNARYIGIDSRLAAALQEKDDMHQERNSAIQSAKLAEARIASLKEKCSKLQEQAGQLREDLETQRSRRRGISEDMIKDARDRLHSLHQAHLGQSSTEDSGVSKVLESLVADNESLKRDSTELQHLLDETQEELRTLQEEVEEHRASNSSAARHRHQDSSTSSVFDDSATLASPFRVGTAPVSSMLSTIFASQQKAGPSSEKRASSAERLGRRAFEPLTPDSTRRPLSPVVSGVKTLTIGGRSRYAPSHRSLDLDEGDPDDPESPIKPTAHKTLLLLTRSRAVQTDDVSTPSVLGMTPLPRAMGDQHDAHSDSSTLADANPSVIGVLIERSTSLLNRIVQADALTLTARLKRQNLLGADVSHLSRSTVNSILNENNALRAQFRTWLEDDKITTTCTRRDLRALFKLFKDMFAEIGQLRVTLNDVILDPSVANKVSEMALHPSKAPMATAGNEAPSAASSSVGWMAPLTKLLGLPGGSNQEEAAARALSPPIRPISRGGSRPPARVAPKREPALSATTTTVNVEFSGTAVGRAVTATSSTRETRGNVSKLTTSASGSSISLASTGELSRNVMDIFAGAPRPAATAGDPWIVIPRTTSLGGRRYDLAGGGTIGRAAMRNAALTRAAANPTLSRVVDAMIDSSQPDNSETREGISDTLLQRTLRPRGLSDSSIHTTFMNHEEDADPQPAAEIQDVRRDKQSVLQALSRKVQSFRVASSSAAPVVLPTAVGAGPSAPVPIRRATQPASSNAGSLMPRLNLSAWASGDIDEHGEPRQPPIFVPVTRGEEPELNRGWGRGI
ncbi:uncharacterized protein PHACADRAFT_115381 [Phanerochaete carnosa HHB-10118-sp]|uniref:Uncharacterized protein n=1 Tax=Phanerochaete carnosa (strain HHB-10118-sp) TaxID=650164 RepID=K5WLD1_PHACS|nr:uncharacterized protein PHACADRAFT_115381 [Phanerochaete carnosa HHB-10118-sp]EKM59989.1 hypothetical protein PHACADRAFT_115381 [Phanerochaete carnosa HHB-10118-sp]